MKNPCSFFLSFLFVMALGGCAQTVADPPGPAVSQAKPAADKILSTVNTLSLKAKADATAVGAAYCSQPLGSRTLAHQALVGAGLAAAGVPPQFAALVPQPPCPGDPGYVPAGPSAPPPPPSD